MLGRTRLLFQYIFSELEVASIRRYFSSFWFFFKRYSILLVFGVSLVISTVSAPLASATAFDDMKPQEQMKSWLYYNALSACISGQSLSGGANGDRISVGDANSGKWFNNPPTGATNPTIGYFLTGAGVAMASPGEKVGCGGNNTAWIVDAAKVWGYQSPIDLLCATGASRADGSDCKAGRESFHGVAAGVFRIHDRLKLETFQNNIKNKVYNGKEPSRSDAANYLHARNALYVGCIGSTAPSPYTGAANDSFLYTVDVVDPSTGVKTPTKFYGAKKSSDSIGYSISSARNNITATCGELASQMSTHANAYAQYIKKLIQDSGSGEETGERACSPGEECDPVVTASSCAIEGVGWIVCPVVNFMASIADSAFNFLSNSFLQVDTQIVSTSSPTYTVWSTMRTIANVLFVIAFLVIIFSQLTGQGIANYGIKKILPRIIVSAILVNVSFFICQIAVDLSNIIGVSLKGFFEGVGNGLDIYDSATPPSTWEGLAGGILAGTAVAAGAWALGATVLIPMLIGAVIALIMVFFILILRQMLIVLLIILAPLAFVAFLLPNTEQWFTKWRKVFVALLLVFPVIGLLFGASSLVSDILSGIYGASGGSTIGEVIAAGLLVLPLFLLPAILKASINAAGNIGTKINGIGDKFSRGSSSKASNSGVLKSLNNRRSIRRAQVGAGVYEGANPLSRLRSRANTRLNRSDAFNSLTGNYGTARGANIEKLDEAEIKTAEAAIKLVADSGREGDTVEAQFAMAIEKNDFVKARAAQNVLMGKGGPGVQAVLDTINTSHGAGHMSDSMGKELASNIKSFHAPTAKQKSTDLLAWSTGGGVGSITSVSGKADTWRKLTAAELSGLNDKAFANAMSSGGVSMATMEALKSERMSGQLSEAKRNAMATHTYTLPAENPITTPLGSQTGTQAPQSTQTPQGTRPPEAPAAPATPPLDPNTLHVDHTPQTQAPIENREQAQNPTPTTEVPQRNENDQTPQAPNSGADS